MKTKFLTLILLTILWETSAQNLQSISQSSNGKNFVYTDGEKVLLIKNSKTKKTLLGEGSSPKWSFNGKKILFESGTGSVTIVSANGKNKHRIQIDTNQYHGLQSYNWHADNKSILLAYGDFPKLKIACYNIESGLMKDLYSIEGFNYGPVATPDGKMILFRSVLVDKDIVVERGLKRVELTNGKITIFPFQGEYPSISPDGQQIAFHWFDTNRVLQIFTSTIDGKNLKQITFGTGGSELPSWSYNGEIIYFQSRQTKEDPWRLFSMNTDGTNIKGLSYKPEF